MRLKMQRMFSLLTMAALVLGLFTAMPMKTQALDIPTLIPPFSIVPTLDLVTVSASNLAKQINLFNPGGTGKLTATVSGYTVTVTGAVAGAINTLTLDIDSDDVVIWKANYSGSNGEAMIELTGSGTFEVAEGSVKNSGDGAAIVSFNTTAINVSGGTVSAANHDGIWTDYPAESPVKVSAGAVSSIWTDGYDSPITVSGGTIGCLGVNTSLITITGGVIGPNQFSEEDYTIYLNGSSSSVAQVTMNGGFLFGYGTAIIKNYDGIISESDEVSTIGGTAVACAWNKAAGNTVYTEGSSTDLIVSPSGATATWGKSGSQSGINYKNGTNTGFFPIDDVTVNATVTQYPVTFNSNGGSEIPQQLVYSGDKVIKPTDPTKPDSTFAGWYKNSGLTNVYDFNDPVSSSFALYAKWEALPSVTTITASSVIPPPDSPSLSTTPSTTTSSAATSVTPGTTAQSDTTSVTTTGGTDSGGGTPFNWMWVAIIALSVTVVICLIVIITRK